MDTTLKLPRDEGLRDVSLMIHRFDPLPVLTAALVAARFFGGNHKEACDYLLEHGYMPKMLTPSRFSRRLHRLFLPLLDLFDCLGMILKSINASTEYLIADAGYKDVPQLLE